MNIHHDLIFIDLYNWYESCSNLFEAIMEEMLGNQYFLTRNYKRAIPEFEKALLKQPGHKQIRKKLILCYTQTGNATKALELFFNLVKEDINFIINTHPIDDDCPCPEIITEMENKQDNNQESVHFDIILGILWLYCDIHKSIHYFRKAVQLDPQNNILNSIVILLEARIEQDNTI